MQAYNFGQAKKVVSERRKFRREGEEKRRDQLVAAALDIIAERGPQAATVRAIADQAGVTQGLIRHYFNTKEDLTRAAYHAHMQRINAFSFAALDSAQPTPQARIAAFVFASLSAPSMSEGAIGLWSAFLQMVRRDPTMTTVHEANYLAFRDRLEGLIAALPGQCDRSDLRQLAIACTAVIDGLWLEGSAYPEGFAEGELADIGARAVGAILGIDLTRPVHEHPRMTMKELPL